MLQPCVCRRTRGHPATAHRPPLPRLHLRDPPPLLAFVQWPSGTQYFLVRVSVCLWPDGGYPHLHPVSPQNVVQRPAGDQSPAQLSCPPRPTRPLPSGFAHVPRGLQRVAPPFQLKKKKRKGIKVRFTHIMWLTSALLLLMSWANEGCAGILVGNP